MDVFGLRNRLVQNYSDYIQSFINIAAKGDVRFFELAYLEAEIKTLRS